MIHRSRSAELAIAVCQAKIEIIICLNANDPNYCSKGNLLLTRKHYLPISFAFDLARLGFEAWMVIGLRAAKLAMGGPAAMLEAQRMVAEKTAAMLEGQAAAGMAIATGSSKAAVARKANAPYRRRVKENRRRLTRKL